MNSDELLAIAGWRWADDGANPSPFQQFEDRLGLSLQRELLIEPPATSSGFDFTTTSPGSEFDLRRLLYTLFLKHFPSEICTAIDVNHGEWEFTPRELKLTSHFEPFPVSVTPWAEYVVFETGDFSHGVFGNPWNRHLVVFGDSFVATFSELHRERLVTARVAARGGGASGR